MKAILITLITTVFSLFAWGHETGKVHTSSDYASPHHRSMSGTSSSIDRSVESPKVAPAQSERSGSATFSRMPTQTSRTMNDYNKAFEMCQSLDPQGMSCADIVQNCMNLLNVSQCVLNSRNQ